MLAIRWSTDHTRIKVADHFLVARDDICSVVPKGTEATSVSILAAPGEFQPLRQAHMDMCVYMRSVSIIQCFVGQRDMCLVPTVSYHE